MVRALIFDCDGVLADTERDGHLPAFNQTFEEFGLPVRWSEEEYGRRRTFINWRSNAWTGRPKMCS
jgi:beta-phosphoglucomutase-like phosphatase (HAD superfamily)